MHILFFFLKKKAKQTNKTFYSEPHKKGNNEVTLLQK